MDIFLLVKIAKFLTSNKSWFLTLQIIFSFFFSEKKRFQKIKEREVITPSYTQPRYLPR